MSQQRLYDEIPEGFEISEETAERWDWDAEVVTSGGERKKLDLYYIKALPHTRSSGRIECLWACHANHKPTRQNLAIYNGHGCCWGLEVLEMDYLRAGNGFHKPTEYREEISCWITRNGERFYPVRFGRGITTALAAAQFKLIQLQEHPIPFFERNWQRHVLQRAVWFRHSTPARITKICQERGEVFIVPDGAERFVPSWYALEGQEKEDWLDNYGDGMWVDYLSEDIQWHRKQDAAQ